MVTNNVPADCEFLNQDEILYSVLQTQDGSDKLLLGFYSEFTSVAQVTSALCGNHSEVINITRCGKCILKETGKCMPYYKLNYDVEEKPFDIWEMMKAGITIVPVAQVHVPTLELPTKNKPKPPKKWSDYPLAA